MTMDGAVIIRWKCKDSKENPDGEHKPTLQGGCFQIKTIFN